MALIVGADISGTFADFAAVDSDKGVVTTITTTPTEPGHISSQRSARRAPIWRSRFWCGLETLA
jgi:N-methylhydantoinase A/oxoprolinase/acetone carboxylase beta subunit